MKPRFLLLLFAICLAVPVAAYAGFTIVNAPPEQTHSDAETVPPPGMGAVTQSNAPLIPTGPSGNIVPYATMANSAPYASAIATGFGRDIPLSIAVKQIVPPGINVTFDSTVDASIPVTWHGGKPWQEVLTDAIRPDSLFISQTPASLVISATRPAYAQGYGAPTVIPAAIQSNSLYPQNLSAQPVPLPPVVIPTWTAKSSDTLHQTLEAWCRKAAVTLRWDSEFDYPIETDVTLSGDFETSVRTLLRGLKNANPRPVAHYYRSKPGVPGVLLVPSPTAENSSRVNMDGDAPAALPPASLPAISNMPGGVNQ